MRKKWYLKINPYWWFMNDDVPTAPGWFFPKRGRVYRKLKWLLRNPLHNFTWYVIGLSGLEYGVRGKFPHLVFRKGWNFSVIEYGLIQLPFVSYLGRVKFYIGWRPDSGAFGFKITKI